MFDLEIMRRVGDRALAHLHAALADPAPRNLLAAAEATTTFAQGMRHYERAAHRLPESLLDELRHMKQRVGTLLEVLAGAMP